MFVGGIRSIGGLREIVVGLGVFVVISRISGCF